MTRSLYRSLGALLLTSSLTLGISSIGLAQEAAEEEKTEELAATKSWADDFSFGAFVDAYGALRSDNNTAHQKSSVDPNAAAGTANPGVVGAFGHDAYVQASGFALAFAGIDAAYAGKNYGATISLRFGPGVARFYGADQSQFGIQNILQAFATWKPFDKLTLDLGQFYTIYGAEVAESWRNQNYSRGGLYYAMQPFWHTGLRANYKINDVIALNAMVVNSVNTAFEGNKAPSIGVQAVITPVDGLMVAAGGLIPITPRDGDDETAPTKNFQDFFDLVATYTVGGFKVVANGDINVYRQAGHSNRGNWWGASIAPGYSFTNWFGVAGRVEYLQDSANVALAMGGAGSEKVHLTTLTGTLDFKPVPNKAWVILRPEFRYEIASNGDYHKWSSDTDLSKHFWSAHLGAVVTSMQ